MRKAISVTIDVDNLLWLKGQARASARETLSSVIDRIITEARLEGRTQPGVIRSVKGSIELPDDDLDLKAADAYVQAIFDGSLRRPLLLKEARAPYKAGNRSKAPQRGR